MEHKTILGGETYLPFARSRIKALRGTGLSYAAQNFIVDGVSVRVRISGEHDFIHIEGGQRYWVFVVAHKALTTSVIYGAPTGTAVSEVHTLLYRLPVSLKAADANLYYHGSTQLTTTFTSEIIYDDGPGGHHAVLDVWLHDVSNSVVDTGTYGALTQFIPYGKDAVMIFDRGAYTFSGTRSSSIGTIPGAVETVSSATKFVWKKDDADQVYDYAYASQKTYPSTTVVTGSRLATSPAMLKQGEVNFKDQTAGVTANKRIVLADTVGPVTDPDWVDSLTSFPLSARPDNPYTRREIGPNFTQIVPSGIFLGAGGGPNGPDSFYNRTLTKFHASPLADGAAQFIGPNMLIKSNTSPTFDLIGMSGNVVHTLDIRDLPGLTADSFFSSAILGDLAFVGNSGGTGAPNYFTEDYGLYHVASPNLPLISNNGFSWKNPATGTTAYGINAGITADQKLLWG